MRGLDCYGLGNVDVGINALPPNPCNSAAVASPCLSSRPQIATAAPASANASALCRPNPRAAPAYLAVGVLQWYEGASGIEKREAPLLVVSVEFVCDNVRIQHIGAEAGFNISASFAVIVAYWHQLLPVG